MNGTKRKSRWLAFLMAFAMVFTSVPNASMLALAAGVDAVSEEETDAVAAEESGSGSEASETADKSAAVTEGDEELPSFESSAADDFESEGLENEGGNDESGELKGSAAGAAASLVITLPAGYEYLLAPQAASINVDDETPDDATPVAVGVVMNTTVSPATVTLSYDEPEESAKKTLFYTNLYSALTGLGATKALKSAVDGLVTATTITYNNKAATPAAVDNGEKLEAAVTGGLTMTGGISFASGKITGTVSDGAASVSGGVVTVSELEFDGNALGQADNFHWIFTAADGASLNNTTAEPNYLGSASVKLTPAISVGSNQDVLTATLAYKTSSGYTAYEIANSSKTFQKTTAAAKTFTIAGADQYVPVNWTKNETSAALDAGDKALMTAANIYSFTAHAVEGSTPGYVVFTVNDAGASDNTDIAKAITYAKSYVEGLNVNSNLFTVTATKVASSEATYTNLYNSGGNAYTVAFAVKTTADTVDLTHTAQTVDSSGNVSGSVSQDVNGNLLDISAGGDAVKVTVSAADLGAAFGDVNTELTVTGGSGYGTNFGLYTDAACSSDLSTKVAFENGKGNVSFFVKPLKDTSALDPDAVAKKITVQLQYAATKAASSATTLSKELSFYVNIKDDESKYNTFGVSYTEATVDKEASTDGVAYTWVGNEGNMDTVNTEANKATVGTAPVAKASQTLKVVLKKANGEEITADAPSLTTANATIEEIGTTKFLDTTVLATAVTSLKGIGSSTVTANITLTPDKSKVTKAHMETDVRISATGFKPYTFHVTIDRYQQVKLHKGNFVDTGASAVATKVDGGKDLTKDAVMYFDYGVDVWDDLVESDGGLNPAAYYTPKAGYGPKFTGNPAISGSVTTSTVLTKGNAQGVKLAADTTFTLSYARTANPTFAYMDAQVGSDEDNTVVRYSDSTKFNLLNIGEDKNAQNNDLYKAVVTIGLNDVVAGDVVKLAPSAAFSIKKILNSSATAEEIAANTAVTTTAGASFTLDETDVENGYVQFEVESASASAAASITLTASITPALGGTKPDDIKMLVGVAQKFIVTVVDNGDLTGMTSNLSAGSTLLVDSTTTCSALATQLTKMVNEDGKFFKIGTKQVASWKVKEGGSVASGSALSASSSVETYFARHDFSVYPVEAARSYNVKFELADPIKGLHITGSAFSNNSSDPALAAPAATTSTGTLAKPTAAVPTGWEWAAYTDETCTTEFIFSNDTRVTTAKNGSGEAFATASEITADTTLYLTLKTDIVLSVSGKGFDAETAPKAGTPASVWSKSTTLGTTVLYGQAVDSAIVEGTGFKGDSAKGAPDFRNWQYTVGGVTYDLVKGTAIDRFVVAGSTLTLNPDWFYDITLKYDNTLAGAKEDDPTIPEKSVWKDGKTGDHEVSFAVSDGETLAKAQVYGVIEPWVKLGDKWYSADVYTEGTGASEGKASGTVASAYATSGTRTLYVKYTQKSLPEKTAFDLYSGNEGGETDWTFYFDGSGDVTEDLFAYAEDAAGEPITGATVTWTTDAPASRMTLSGTSSVTDTTTAAGTIKGAAKNTITLNASGGYWGDGVTYRVFATLNNQVLVFNISMSQTASLVISDDETDYGEMNGEILDLEDNTKIQNTYEFLATFTAAVGPDPGPEHAAYRTYGKSYAGNPSLLSVIKEWEETYAPLNLFLPDEGYTFTGLTVASAYTYTDPETGVSHTIAADGSLLNHLLLSEAYEGAVLSGSITLKPVFSKVHTVKVELDPAVAGKTVGGNKVSLPEYYDKLLIVDTGDASTSKTAVAGYTLPTASALNAGDGWTAVYFYKLNKYDTGHYVNEWVGQYAVYELGTTTLDMIYTPDGENPTVYVGLAKTVTLKKNDQGVTTTDDTPSAGTEHIKYAKYDDHVVPYYVNGDLTDVFAATTDVAFFKALYGHSLVEVGLPENEDEKHTYLFHTTDGTPVSKNLYFAGWYQQDGTDPVTGKTQYDWFDPETVITDETLAKIDPSQGGVALEQRWIAPVIITLRDNGQSGENRVFYDSFAEGITPDEVNAGKLTLLGYFVGDTVDEIFPRPDLVVRGDDVATGKTFGDFAAWDSNKNATVVYDENTKELLKHKVTDKNTNATLYPGMIIEAQDYVVYSINESEPAGFTVTIKAPGSKGLYQWTTAARAYGGTSADSDVVYDANVDGQGWDTVEAVLETFVELTDEAKELYTIDGTSAFKMVNAVSGSTAFNEEGKAIANAATEKIPGDLIVEPNIITPSYIVNVSLNTDTLAWTDKKITPLNSESAKYVKSTEGVKLLVTKPSTAVSADMLDTLYRSVADVTKGGTGNYNTGTKLAGGEQYKAFGFSYIDKSTKQRKYIKFNGTENIADITASILPTAADTYDLTLEFYPSVVRIDLQLGTGSWKSTAKSALETLGHYSLVGGNWGYLHSTTAVEGASNAAYTVTAAFTSGEVSELKNTLLGQISAATESQALANWRYTESSGTKLLDNTWTWTMGTTEKKLEAIYNAAPASVTFTPGGLPYTTFINYISDANGRTFADSAQFLALFTAANNAFAKQAKNQKLGKLVSYATSTERTNAQTALAAFEGLHVVDNEGYTIWTFDGWYTTDDKGVKTPFDPEEDVITGTTTLNAYWATDVWIWNEAKDATGIKPYSNFVELHLGDALTLADLNDLMDDPQGIMSATPKDGDNVAFAGWYKYNKPGQNYTKLDISGSKKLTISAEASGDGAVNLTSGRLEMKSRFYTLLNLDASAYATEKEDTEASAWKSSATNENILGTKAAPTTDAGKLSNIRTIRVFAGSDETAEQVETYRTTNLTDKAKTGSVGFYTKDGSGKLSGSTAPDYGSKISYVTAAPQTAYLVYADKKELIHIDITPDLRGGYWGPEEIDLVDKGNALTVANVFEDMKAEIGEYYLTNGQFGFTGFTIGSYTFNKASDGANVLLSSLAKKTTTNYYIAATANYAKTRLEIEIKEGTYGKFKTEPDSYVIYDSLESDGTAKLTKAELDKALAEANIEFAEINTASGYFLDATQWTIGNKQYTVEELAEGITMTEANAVIKPVYAQPVITAQLVDSEGKAITKTKVALSGAPAALELANQATALNSRSKWLVGNNNYVHVPTSDYVSVEITTVPEQAAKYVVPTIGVTSDVAGTTPSTKWAAQVAKSFKIYAGADAYDTSETLTVSFKLETTADASQTYARSVRLTNGLRIKLNDKANAVAQKNAAIGDGLIVVLNDYTGKSVNGKAITSLDQLVIKDMTSAPNNGIRSVGAYAGSLTWAEEGNSLAKNIKFNKYKDSAESVDVDVIYTNGSYTEKLVVPVSFVTVNYTLDFAGAAGTKDYLQAKLDANGDIDSPVEFALNVHYTAPQTLLKMLNGTEVASTEAGRVIAAYGTEGGAAAGVGLTNSWAFSAATTVGKDKYAPLTFEADNTNGLSVGVNEYAVKAGAFSKRQEIKFTGSYNGGDFTVNSKIVVTTGAYGLTADTLEVSLGGGALTDDSGQFKNIAGGAVLDGYDGVLYTYSNLVDHTGLMRVHGTIEGGVAQLAALGGDTKKLKFTVKSDAAKVVTLATPKEAGVATNPVFKTIDGNANDLAFDLYFKAANAGQAVVSVKNNDDNQSEFRILFNIYDGSVAAAPATLTYNTNQEDKTLTLWLDPVNANNDGGGADPWDVDIDEISLANFKTAPVGLTIKAQGIGGATNHRYITFDVSDAAVKSQNLVITPVVKNTYGGTEYTLTKNLKPISVKLTVSTKAPTAKAVVTTKPNLAYREPSVAFTLTSADWISKVQIVNTDGKNYTQTKTANLDVEKGTEDYFGLNGALGTTTASYFGGTKEAKLNIRMMDFAKSAQVASKDVFPSKIVLKVFYTGYDEDAVYSYVTLAPSYVNSAPTVKVSNKNFTLYQNPAFRVDGGRFTFDLTTKAGILGAGTNGKVTFAVTDKVNYKTYAENKLYLSTDADQAGSDISADINTVADAAGNRVGQLVRFDVAQGETITAPAAWSNCLVYSDDTYRGINLGVNIKIDTKTATLKSFGKIEPITLNRTNIADYGVTELMIAPGVFGDLKNLSVVPTAATAKKVGESLKVQFKDEATEWDAGDGHPVLGASFGAYAPAKGSYTYTVSGTFQGKLLTQTLTVKVVETKTEESVKFTKTGSLNNYDRANSFLTVKIQKTGVNGTISNVEFVNPTLTETFQIVPANAGDFSTFYIKLKDYDAAKNIFTKTGYDLRVKMDIQSLGGAPTAYTFDAMQPADKAQSALKGVKIAQTNPTFALKIGGKNTSGYTVSGTENQNGFNFNIGVTTTLKSNTAINELDVGNDGGSGNNLNNRRSEAVYDSTKFNVTLAAGGITISNAAAKPLAKGNYRIRFYLYPESCANDTAAKVINYTIKVQ